MKNNYQRTLTSNINSHNPEPVSIPPSRERPSEPKKKDQGPKKP